MAHYQIEIRHPDKGCASSLNMIVNMGMHMLDHTWWGCETGIHAGWLDIEADSEQDALYAVPPPMRREARVIEVTRFTPSQIMAVHG